MLTKREKSVAKLIQQDIPLAKRPFNSLGEQARISEEEVLTTIQSLIRKGIIRKFGTILRHQKAGFTHNAMVIWAVPKAQRNSVGEILAAFREVSHCYERTPPFMGKYTLFTMIHFGEGEDESILRKLSQATGIMDYKILISEEEYKKSSMEYFTDGT